MPACCINATRPRWRRHTRMHTNALPADDTPAGHRMQSEAQAARSKAAAESSKVRAASIAWLLHCTAMPSRGRASRHLLSLTYSPHACRRTAWPPSWAAVRSSAATQSARCRHMHVLRPAQQSDAARQTADLLLTSPCTRAWVQATATLNRAAGERALVRDRGGAAARLPRLHCQPPSAHLCPAAAVYAGGVHVGAGRTG